MKETKSNVCPLCNKIILEGKSLKKHMVKCGPNNYNFGKKNSVEANEKNSKSNKGKHKERKGKTYEEIVGVEKAKDWKGKQSLKQAGENNPMFGKTFNHTEEAKKKISIATTGEGNPNYISGKYIKKETK